MTIKPLTRPAASPVYALLLVAAALVGLRDSMAEPFFILFADEKEHLSPLPLGLLLTVRALGAVGFSMAFGMWLDRRPSMRPLLLALVLGVAGYLALAVTPSFPLLLLIGAGPLAANVAAFPQLFALAKGHLDQAGGLFAERGIAMMRAMFSAAWAIGPIFGAALVERFDFRGVFLASALCGLTTFAALVLGGMRAPPTVRLAQSDSAPVPSSFGIGVSAAGFTFFSMAIVMGAVALPIVVTHDLHGTKSDVGLMSSFCALLEVPVMLAVALRPSLLGGFGGLAAGFATLVIYFLAIAWAPSVTTVLLAQAARAVAIGLGTCVGISFMQELMPGRAGAAAALFTNTGQIGALLAGLAAGEWAALFGYRSMFLACAGLAGAGLLLVCVGAKPVRVSRPAI